MDPSDESLMDAAEERLRTVLRELATLKEAHEQLEFETVQLARHLGMSWTRIGEAHDPPISREAATKRYSHAKPRRRRS